MMSVNANRTLKKSFSTSSVSSMRISVSPPRKLPPNPVEKLADRIDELWKVIADRDDTIQTLTKRVTKLEQQNEINKSTEFVKDRVIDELRAEVDRQQMYTRRYSVNIAGIEKRRGEKPEDLKREVVSIVNEVDSDVNESDIDKLHRDGPVNGTQQDVIVRFKTHSAKESFYKKRKTLDRRGVKIRPSLSKQRKSLLNEANDVINTYRYKESADHPMYNPPEFVYANVHGDILMKMSIPTKKGLFIKINSIEQMSLAICEAQFVEGSLKRYEEKFFNRYNDTEFMPNNDGFLANVDFDDTDSGSSISLR